MTHFQTCQCDIGDPEDKALFYGERGGKGEKKEEEKREEREMGVGGENCGERDQRGKWDEVRTMGREGPRAMGEGKDSGLFTWIPSAFMSWHAIEVRFPRLLNKQ